MTEEPLNAASIVEVFNSLFADSDNTRLIAGGEEPIYLPADRETPYHRILFREDFVASALHEVAHWCVAGEARRLQRDFGYWYAPDGRDAAQQRAFERVEVKPQALEWIFSRSCGLRFRPSVDNLAGCWTDPTPFAEAITQRVRVVLETGLAARPALFANALCLRWGTGQLPDIDAFRCELILPEPFA